MEPLSVFALVFACVAGWIVISIAAAFTFARLIGRADEARRSSFTQKGVRRGSLPPERATMR